MKTNILKSCTAIVLGLLLSSQAFALNITPDSGTLDVSRWEVSDGKPDALSPAEVSAIVGVTDLEEYYKQDQGGGESGSFAGSYSTEFFNTPNDPADATITFTGGTPITCPECFLVVKDGNQVPNAYIFDLYALGWNGTDPLVMTGFWPQQGAISYVGIYGKGDIPPPPPPPDVPEPSALWLLGLGLVGLARYYRNQEKSVLKA